MRIFGRDLARVPQFGLLRNEECARVTRGTMDFWRFFAKLFTIYNSARVVDPVGGFDRGKVPIRIAVRNMIEIFSVLTCNESNGIPRWSVTSNRWHILNSIKNINFRINTVLRFNFLKIIMHNMLYTCVNM